LGFTDSTVAIYWQEHHDGTLRVVNVEATQGKDIFHHIERLQSFQSQVELGEVWLPHDAKARNLQTGRSIVEQFLYNDIRPSIVPAHKVRDRIMATRKLFPRINFDEDTTGDLIEALKGYRREWDDNLLCFKEQPLHDWCSDYADSFGYMCVVASPKYDRSSRSADANKPIPGDIRVPEFHLNNLFSDYDMRRNVQRRIM
jgi:phage terminase large subunit